MTTSTEYDLRTFFGKWSAAWQRAGKDAPSKKGSGEVDPALLGGWLAGACRGRAPAEVVARTWAAYAGDTRGPSAIDAIDLYLDRMLSSGDRQSAESCATGWIAEGSGAFSERLLRRGTSVGTLVDLGFLERRPAGRLSFTFPALGAYLAGRSLGDTGIAPAAPTAYWQPAECALRWFAATGDVAPIVEERLKSEGDPLSLNLLACARWLPDAPAKASWRANLLRGLASIAQKDAQPYGLMVPAGGNHVSAVTPAPRPAAPAPPEPAANPRSLPRASTDGNIVGALTAPMPGKILSVEVNRGDRVSRGQTLVTLEAMKMKNAIKSPYDGVVLEIAVRPEQTVAHGALLVQLGEE